MSQFFLNSLVLLFRDFWPAANHHQNFNQLFFIREIFVENCRVWPFCLLLFEPAGESVFYAWYMVHDIINSPLVYCMTSSYVISPLVYASRVLFCCSKILITQSLRFWSMVWSWARMEGLGPPVWWNHCTSLRSAFVHVSGPVGCSRTL